MSDKTTIIISNSKSPLAAFILTFFLGPIGMLYSTVWGALIMTGLMIFTGTATLGLSLLILWPICIAWAVLAATDSKKIVKE